MSYLGWFLAVGGIAGVIFGLRMMMKGKKMQTVPFKTPSEIATQGQSAADAKGMISTEGAAEPGAEALVAPMSGLPCLAYEIKIERKWEKEIQTEKGMEKKTGSESIKTEYKGSQFKITGGGGSVDVDVRKQPDAEFESAHSSTIKVGMMIPGSLQFGKLQLNTPSVSKDSRTVSFIGTEKILKPAATLYAMGALQGGMITEPSGALSGKLTLSSKGRAHLVAATKRNMIMGYAIGGVLTVGGSLLGILGPAPAPGAPSCSDFTNTVNCAGKIYEADGSDFKWTVPADGVYRLVLKQPKGMKFPIDGTLTISDSEGKQVAYNDGGEPGANAMVSQAFKAGTYKVNVRDFARHKMNGGYSYSLEVTSDAPAVAGAGAGTAAAAIIPAGSDIAAAGGGEACAKAVKCCKAISGKNTGACDALTKSTAEVCTSVLGNYRKAAAHMPAAKAACN